MSDIIKTYAQVVADTVAQIAGETEAVDKAAQLVADAIKRDELVHVIGPGGHSNMAVEEVLWRGIRVLDAYGINKPGEVMIIVNAYGINSMTIDVALECRRRGLKTIGITSDSFARIVPKDAPSRHPSGLNLFENVDVYVNNHLPEGDACIAVEGVSQHMGPMSTYCNCFAIDCVMMKAAEKLAAEGIDPPVWMSANMPGGDAANKALEEKYFMRVKHLR